MGIRETVNQNPGVTAGAVGGIVLLAVIYIGMQLFGGGRGNAAQIPQQAFYTIDDGATYFPESRDRVPPFDYQGKPAVLAHVFTCNGGKTKFVGYLERYSPGGQKKLREMLETKKDLSFEIEINGKEVKAPKTGERGWILKGHPAASEIMNPKCPDGKPEDLTEVYPE